MRIEALGIRHQAQRWRLVIEKEGPDRRSPRSPRSADENQSQDTRSPRSPSPATSSTYASAGAGNRADGGSRAANQTLDARSPSSPAEGNVRQRSHPRSPDIVSSNQPVGERWERGERFSNAYARAIAHVCARTRARGRPGKSSPPSPRSPSPEISKAWSWERVGERCPARSHHPGAAPTAGPRQRHVDRPASRCATRLRRAGGGVPGSSPPPP